MGKRWLVICPVASFRVLTISDASPRGIIKVVKIGDLSCGCGCGSLINLAIKFTGTTSANEAGKEDEDKNEEHNANDREHSGNRGCVMEETETIVSEVSRRVGKDRRLWNCMLLRFAADAFEERGRSREKSRITQVHMERPKRPRFGNDRSSNLAFRGHNS
jgi:hypothetical protein